MKSTLRLFAGLFVSLLFSVSAMAQSPMDTLGTKIMEDWSPIVTDRPDITESAVLVPRGYFQMEHGFRIDDANGDYIYTTPSSLWKYGLNDNFELRVTSEYVFVDKLEDPDQRGFLPFSFGFKAKLTEQKGFLPKMSFIGHLAVPGLTDETFRSEYLAPNIKLAFLHSVSSLYSLGYNAGLAWNGVSPHPTFTYSIANGFSITKRLGLYVEAYGEALQRDFDNITVRADGGLTYIIGQDFMVDVSGGVGVTNNAPERFVSVGFSYRFKL